MQTYSYLRISTCKQDIENQRHGVEQYADSRSLTPVTYVEDTVTTRIKWKERTLGELLLNTMQTGDVLIVSELSRLARSMLETLEIMEVVREKSLTVHVVKQNLILGAEGNPMVDKMLVFGLSLASELEREFISLRTKEALAKRKAKGLPIGRRPGVPAENLKLDPQREEIETMYQYGMNLSQIARHFKVARCTLQHWCDRRHPEWRQRKGED